MSVALVRTATAAAIAALVALAVPSGAVAGETPLPFPMERCTGGAATDGIAARRVWCGRLRVPLDHANPARGRTTIAFRYYRSTGQPARNRRAVVALAGGPGQGATPIWDLFYTSLQPALRERDLLVVDTRGTGYAALLRCPDVDDFEEITLRAVRACGKRLGARGKYLRTSQVVQDLELLRRRMRFGAISLYGVSYGTYVAQVYAARYPGKVDRLVLDSVVDIEQDPFQRLLFRAIGRSLTELCASGACAGITADPAGDLRAAVRSLERRRVTFAGRPYGAAELVSTWLATDFAPGYRRLLPAAVRAAAARDSAPLGRVVASAGPLNANGLLPPRQEEDEDFDLRALSPTAFVAQACNDLPAPWRASDPRAVRLRKLRAAAARIGGAGPFGRETLLASSLLKALCLDWPHSGRVAPVRSVPDVPALLIAGSQDVRTSAEEAAAVARRLPRARRVIVANVGHSVITSEVEGCGTRAVRAFFAGEAAPACDGDRALPPVPLPPRRLSETPPEPGLGGVRGRTLTAVRAAVEDAFAQLPGLALLAFGQVNGVRGGFGVLGEDLVQLADYAAVEGVNVSGTLTLDPGGAVRGAVTVRGTGSLGFVRATPAGLEGELDGEPFTAPPFAPVRASAYSR